MASPEPSPRLPEGVRLIDLATHPDERGHLAEIFRDEWHSGVEPVQWNLVASKAGVLRGVHVHKQHDDYLIVAQGRAVIGLCDLRLDSPTRRCPTCVPLSGDTLRAIVIPHGVAHGFYFTEPSLHIYSVSHYWDPADELGCRWDDADLGIPWPCQSPALSPRDAVLPSLADLLRQLAG